MERPIVCQGLSILALTRHDETFLVLKTIFLFCFLEAGATVVNNIEHKILTCPLFGTLLLRLVIICF